MNYPYYAPYQRQMQGYYNPIVPQEQPNFQQPQYQQASAMPPATGWEKAECTELLTHAGGAGT